MQLKHRIHNSKENIKIHFIKYAYLYAPTLGLLLYFLLSTIKIIKLDSNYESNLINVSGILAGFLFTSLGIIISLPDNKFTQVLRQIGYLKIIYKSMIVGISTLLLAMLFGLFSVGVCLANILFIIGISETFLSAYYLYKVSYYSDKSK